jgi:hypothetical protein
MDQKSAEAAYKTILGWADVSWDKITHMRKAGIEQGSARGGLQNEEVWTMSKHKRGSKLENVYMTELSAKVMLVMAGFLENTLFLGSTWKCPGQKRNLQSFFSLS